jgi:ABC-type sugar transport system ATPase subunit
MITLTNLTVRAGAFTLPAVSFEVPTGGYAALMGKTGSGKTTILEAICGLRKVVEGSIQLLGRDVTHLKPAERELGYVPQDRALFNSMSVWDNLAFALNVRKWPWQAISARVGELAELLGIGDLLERKPHRLSGGEAQRVALGRALSCRPQVLLLDEPLAALDEETKEEMYNLLKSVRQHTGVTTLHVTHDRSEAERLADRLFVLKGGAIQEMPLAPRQGHDVDADGAYQDLDRKSSTRQSAERIREL